LDQFGDENELPLKVSSLEYSLGRLGMRVKTKTNRSSLAIPARTRWEETSRIQFDMKGLLSGFHGVSQAGLLGILVLFRDGRRRFRCFLLLKKLGRRLAIAKTGRHPVVAFESNFCRTDGYVVERIRIIRPDGAEGFVVILAHEGDGSGVQSLVFEENLAANLAQRFAAAGRATDNQQQQAPQPSQTASFLVSLSHRRPFLPPTKLGAQLF